MLTLAKKYSRAVHIKKGKILLHVESRLTFESKMRAFGEMNEKVTASRFSFLCLYTTNMYKIRTCLRMNAAVRR